MDLSVPVFVLLIGGIIGGLLGFFVAVVLFRSACDLCSVEPPGWLKSSGLVLLGAVLNSPVSLVAFLIVGAFARTLDLSIEMQTLLATILSLPVSGIIATVLYMFALKVRFFKGALIWLLQSVLSILVATLTVLLLVGVWTVIEGVKRVL